MGGDQKQFPSVVTDITMVNRPNGPQILREGKLSGCEALGTQTQGKVKRRALTKRKPEVQADRSRGAERNVLFGRRQRFLKAHVECYFRKKVLVDISGVNSKVSA